MIKTAVILAAVRGEGLQGLFKDNVPKGFVSMNGQTIIEAAIEKLKKNGIEKVIVVTGYLGEFYEQLAEKLEGVVTVRNEVYATSGSMYSLYVTRELLENVKVGFLLLEGDLIFKERALATLLNHPQPNAVLMSGFTKSGDEVWIESRNNLLVNMSKNAHELNHVDGELFGISKFSAEMYSKMLEVAQKMFEQTLKVEYEQCIVRVAQDFEVSTPTIDGRIWGKTDDPNHLKRVLEFVEPRFH